MHSHWSILITMLIFDFPVKVDQFGTVRNTVIWPLSEVELVNFSFFLFLKNGRYCETEYTKRDIYIKKHKTAYKHYSQMILNGKLKIEQHEPQQI